jgi:SAM-dependent methyltransferase
VVVAKEEQQMHRSSMKNMDICIKKHLEPLRLLTSEKKLKVIDIGALDVNGSYRTLFDKAAYDYIGADLASGKGVDLEMTDPYRIPVQDNFADCVISGQMLEHNEFFWLTFAEMIRILNNTGYLFLIAPSKGPIHRYPVDCYRFYPDSYAGLAKLTNTILVDCWMDTKSEWGDLVGVFVKTSRKGATNFDTKLIWSSKRTSIFGIPVPFRFAE